LFPFNTWTAIGNHPSHAMSPTPPSRWRPGRFRPAPLPAMLLAGQMATAILGAGTAAADPPAVALVVNADSPQLDFQRLGPELAAAIGGPVVPATGQAAASARGTVTVTWRPSRQELAVTYQDRQRGTLSRIVPAPAELDDVVAEATALAANLVRNEADELLGTPAVPPAPVAPPPAHAPPTTASVTVATAAAPVGYAPVVASAFYPLATNHELPDIRTRLSLNLLYGRVGQLDGAQLGLGANSVDGPVSGVQLAFGFNLADGPVGGAQAALGLNYAAGPVSGFQASMLFNRSGGGRGLQFSLGVNSAGGTLSGLQAAAVNVAGDLRGVQVGLVNVARNVRGLQLGLINYADDVEGIPIGIISVTRSGGVHPVVWSGSESLAAVGLKLSTRYTYTLLSGAVRREDDQNLYGPGLAFGVRVPFLPGYFESDLGASFLFGGRVCCVDAKVGLSDDVLLPRWRSLIGFQAHHRFSVFAGAALTAVTRFHQPRPDGSTADATVDLRPELFAGVQL
jgi:hypothetical protein